MYDDVYAQHLLDDGSWSWGEGGLAASNARGRQRDAKLAVDGDSLLVAWYDYRHESEDETPQDLYLQRINAQGAPLMEEGGEAFVTEGGARLAMAMHVLDGRAVVTWMDRRDERAPPNIQAWFENPVATTGGAGELQR